MLFCIFCFFVRLPVVMGEDDPDNKVVVRVVNEQGKPMLGVNIKCYFDGACRGITNENGIVILTVNKDTVPEDCCVVVLSLSGYKQISKVFKYGTKEITVTMPSNESIWSPPLCNSVSNISKYSGWDLKILVPADTEVKSFPDFDNIRIHIEFKSKQEHQWMELGTGHLWLAAVPYKSLILSHVIEEREIKGKDYYYEYIDNNENVLNVQNHIGIDYRGIDNHGKKWREIGFRTQTISYKNATPEAAEYFDKIIDSLCVDPMRVIKGEQRRLSGIPDFWK